MKYLHLIRWEVRSPGQDCEPVLHYRWSRVGLAKVCSCDVIAGIISNGDTPGKRWTIMWNPVNCIPWVFFLHLAHKRFQPFIIVERKNKRFRSKAIATTGFWETKSTQNKKKKLNICFHVCLIKKNDVIFYSHQSSFCSFTFLFKRLKFINPIEVNVTDNIPDN